MSQAPRYLAPRITPFEAAVFHFQHQGTRARRCANAECSTSIFFRREERAAVLFSACALPAQRESNASGGTRIGRSGGVRTCEHLVAATDAQFYSMATERLQALIARSLHICYIVLRVFRAVRTKERAGRGNFASCNKIGLYFVLSAA